MNAALTASFALLVHLAKAAPVPTQSFGIAQAVLFYVTAIFMVACALGVALCKQAAHSAVCMVGVMLGLAVLYFSQGALFLAVVQVVVYTGAIMILFLFVLMLVGVAASDNYRRTQAPLRYGAWMMGIVGAIIIVACVISAHLPATGGVVYHGTVTNPVAVAFEIFSHHIFTMELTGALLILAAIGAVTLTHTDALTKIMKQPETAEAKMRAYAATGRHPGQMPAPGVYATTNAVTVAALSGEDGKPVEESVPRAVRAQGAERLVVVAAPQAIVRAQADQSDHPERGMHSIAASKAVRHSQSWGMPGHRHHDTSLAQPQTRDIRPRELAPGESVAPQLTDTATTDVTKPESSTPDASTVTKEDDK